MARRLLVVDDDADLLAMLRDFFEKKGFDVLLAVDGMRAMDIVRQEPLDLVLLDMGLPVMDGLEVLRAIRGSRPRVPVLVITASRDIDLARRVLSCGANDFITKPLDFGYLQYAAGVFSQAAQGPGFFPLKGIL